MSMGAAPSQISRLMIDIVKVFCGIHIRSVVDATPCEVKVDTNAEMDDSYHIPSTPSAPACLVCESKPETGHYADVLSVTSAGYGRLVSSRVFYPFVASHTSSSLYIPSVDGWNVVESACLLFLQTIGPVTKYTIIEKMDTRLVLCACVCIACKNALDSDAFPKLRDTLYRHTPLAVVYHTIFECVVTDWNDLEMDAQYMQKSIEEAEGRVIKQTKDELFRLLNDTHTLRFEADVFHITTGDGCLDVDCRFETLVCRMRNVVSFYVYHALISSDEEVRTIAAMRPSVESTRAFAEIAVESMLCDASVRDDTYTACIPIPLVRLAMKPPVGSHRLSIRIVEAAIRARPVVKKDEHQFDHDTMRVVLRALQEKKLH